MANQIQIRRDTSANWALYNPVLHDGEPGIELDTFRIKYGDGTTAWNSLPYLLAGESPAHEWSGTLLRFKNPDGSWGEWTDLSADISYKANIASPAFTGNPTAPTPAVGDNDTSIATTAFVNAEINNDRPYATVNPLMDGVAAVGTSAKVAREDHVHPSDTTKADLASPALTGTPTAPTASVTTDTTQIATTEFVNDEIAHNTRYLTDFRVWTSGRAYAINDPVFYEGVPYRSLQADNTNNQPDISPTYWEVTGGGSDASNPGVTFENGQFESSSTSWATYDDGAVAAPVDGTGGTPSYLAFARTATSPLIGTGSGLMTKSAASALGEGVSTDFTIDRGIVHEAMKIEFQYETSANYADGYVGVFLYDKTNAALIPLSVQDIPASYGKPATFLATFIPSNSTSYRLIFHVTTSTTTSWTMMIDNVVVGNKDTAVGAAISEWQSYPISVDGVVVGTGGSYNGKWRRVGSNMEYQGHFILGTSGFIMPNPPMVLNLPLGLTADASKVSRETGYSRLDGNAQSYDSSTGAGYLAIPVLYPNGKIVFITHGSGAVGLSNPFAWAANDEFYFNISVPIAQWTSNVNLASDFTEYASNDGSGGTAAGAVYNTGMQYGPEGSAFVPINSTSGGETTYRICFQRPIQNNDAFFLEIKAPNCNWEPIPISRHVCGRTLHNTVYYGAALLSGAVGATETYVSFGNGGRLPATTYGGTGSILWSDLSNSGTRWRVRKISNGNMAEVPPLVRAEYRRATPQSFAIGVYTRLNLDSKIVDTQSIVTTGTSWAIAIPISGVYVFRIGLLIASASWSAGTQAELDLVVNADTYYLDRVDGAAYAGYMHLKGNISLNLKAGDVAYFRVYTAINSQLHGDSRYNFVDIDRIGS